MGWQGDEVEDLLEAELGGMAHIQVLGNQQFAPLVVEAWVKVDLEVELRVEPCQGNAIDIVSE